jgi:hypothetical protein
MKFKAKQKKFLKKYNKINVIEDHLIDGGFYSWLSESVQNSNLTSKSINNKIISKIGSQKFLMKYLK